MKESVFNKKVEEHLSVFESITDIQPSSEWNRELMLKINRTDKGQNPAFQGTGLKITLLIFIILNLGFLFNTLNNSTNSKRERSTELNTLSEELLINPSSLNN